jgi:hypothetical protein
MHSLDLARRHYKNGANLRLWVFWRFPANDVLMKIRIFFQMNKKFLLLQWIVAHKTPQKNTHKNGRKIMGRSVFRMAQVGLNSITSCHLTSHFFFQARSKSK